MTTPLTDQQLDDDRAIQVLSNQGAQCGDCGDQPGDRICPDCERCRGWYVAALRKAGWAPQPEHDALLADRAAVLTEAERTMFNFALNQAQLKIWSRGGYTDEDQAAVNSLRRMADEARQTDGPSLAAETPQPETQATESVIYQVVGDWGVDGADSAEGARAAVAKWLRAYPKCGAFAQQRIVRDWPDGSEYYGPWTDLPAVVSEPGKEA